MGNNLTSEEQIVLSTRKTFFKRKGVKTTDYALRNILIWAKSQNFKTDVTTTFSVRSWKEFGETLWEVIQNGGKAAADLSSTGRLLYNTLKEWKAEQNKKDLEEVERELKEELEVAGEQQRGEAQPESSAGIFSAETVAGSVATGNGQQFDKASLCLSAKGFKSMYPSPTE